MLSNNFAELRRVRSEMSAAAGHDIRKFIELLEPFRRKYAANLVNHGAEAESPAIVSAPVAPLASESSNSPVR